MNKEEKKKLKEIDNKIDEYKDIKNTLIDTKINKENIIVGVGAFIFLGIVILPFGLCPAITSEMVAIGIVPAAAIDVFIAHKINPKLSKKQINKINEKAMYYYTESKDIDENMEILDDLILEEKINKKMHKYKEKTWDDIKTPEELYGVIDTIQKCLGDNLNEEESKYLKKTKKLVGKYIKENKNSNQKKKK